MSNSIDLFAALSELSYSTTQLVAVVLGIVWTSVSFYTYTPVVQLAVSRAVDRLRGRRTVVDPDEVPIEEWPTLEVFVAAYDEPAVIEEAVRTATASRYPAEKLTVTVLTEPGDDATNAVVDRIADRYEFTHRLVPTDYPGTPNKPRALNYGFEHSTAEIVGVIDAEDIVDEALFATSALTISHGEPDFTHGVLDMTNEADGWINLLFRAEYGYWFRLVAPGFVRIGYDVPLPGTTCFFDAAVLREIDGIRREKLGSPWDDAARAWLDDHGLSGITPWDPENVTEDFEIGLLLSASDFTPGYVPVVTAEESPREVNDWIRQRTRWQKGKVYTFLRYRGVLPSGLKHKLHFSYQSLLPHLGPLNIAAVVVVFFLSGLLAYQPLSLVRAVLSVGLAFVALAVGFHLLGYWLASDAPLGTRLRRSVIVAVGVFPYWVLQWGADVRAIVQTYAGQFDWEHTPHVGRAIADADEPLDEHRFEPTYTMSGIFRDTLLGLILLVGLALRIPRIGTQSLWSDEIYSVAVRASFSLPDLLLADDPHPPLYYLLLKGWMALFGNGPAPARWFSVVCSLGAVYLAYSVGMRLFDDRTGLLLAALLSVSTFHVHFGRTARMYALFSLLTLLSWYAFLSVRNGSTLQRAGYAFATAGVLYTHVFGVFVVGAQWIYLLLTTPRSRDRGPERRAVLGVAVLSLPLVGFFARLVFASGSEDGPALDWIPAPSPELLEELALLYAGYPDIYPIMAGSQTTRIAALVVAAVGLVGLTAAVFDSVRPDDDTHTRAVAQMLSLAGVTVGGALLISLLYRPVLIPRYTLPASIGVSALVVTGLRNLPVRPARAVAVVLLISGLLVGGVAYHNTETFEDWEGATAAIEGGATPATAVVYQPGWTRTNVEYYDEGPTPAAYQIDPDVAVGTPDARLAPGTEQQLSAALTNHETVWYVQYNAPFDAPTSEWLRSNAETQYVENFGIVTVYQFQTAEAESTATVEAADDGSATTIARALSTATVVSPA
ncbi:glycosyltransferase [Halolamina sp. C58]|uniref:glycosyltransferase n=1 Tax=Halolamina sp. C58 TaxID=3421640 RepID=UPI003EBA9A22